MATRKMNRRSFNKDRMPGSLVDIGSGRVCFSPDPLPPQLDLTIAGEVHRLGLRAMYALGRLREIAAQLDRPRMIQLPFIYKEALDSSEIEGTRVTLPDLYTYSLDATSTTGRATAPTLDSPTENLQEVENYVTAMEYGLDHLDEGLTTDLLRSLHGILLGTGEVRSHDETPGEFRDGFVTIGGDVGTRFVPPSPEIARSRMQSLEQFLRTGSQYDVLVDIALAHYQFETIHPFNDGNGRVGRLLVALQLCKHGLLPRPYLHLSGFIKQRKSEYTDRLLAVSQQGDWEGWLRFFLTGLATQAEDACRRANDLIDLRAEYDARVADAPPSVKRLVGTLFTHPVLTAATVVDRLDCSKPTAYQAIAHLEAEGILREVTGKERNRRYHCEEILSIIDAPVSVLEGTRPDVR